MPKLNPGIFREYDIRGIVDEDLNEETYLLLGKAFGTFIKRKGGKKVCVCRDNRLSSGKFAESLVKGINSTGVSVLDIGENPVPLSYFTVLKKSLDGAATVTASHNPIEFNGLKLAYKHMSLFGESIQKMRELIESNDFDSGKGKTESFSPEKLYIEEICSKIRLKKKLKVVLDCGNGTASALGPKFLRALGCEVIELYCNSDGSFPNHLPDPTREELMKDLMKKVAEEKADLGIGFDGDGDRIGAVNEKGELVFPDKILVLFAREILSKNPGAKIIIEVKCTQALIEEVEKHGGKPILWKTGYSLIEEKMRQESALLAGEMSGHVYFADEFYGFNDALYAAARLLRIVSEKGKPFSELFSDIPKYFSTPELRIDYPEEEKFELIKKLVSAFKAEHEVIGIDGARVLFPEGWALVRASNTQPKIIVRIESKTREGLEKIRAIVRKKINEFSFRKIDF